MRESLYRGLEVVYWTATALIGLFAALAKSDSTFLTAHAGVFLPLLNAVKGEGWLLFSASIASVGAASGKKWLGEPWVKHAVKQVLDEMQKHAFEGLPASPNFYFRVTLFKHHKGFCWRALCAGRWPWDAWLLPFARSGHLTQKTKVFFRVPDNADEAEGFAGQTYARDVMMHLEGLPNVAVSTRSENDLRVYATKTFVDVDWLREESSTARSLVGIPLKVEGDLWGVIVVDSRDDSIKNVDAINRAYGLVAKVLGVVLRRS